MFKLPQNCTHFTCKQGHAQNLQARFQQYVNQELPDIQAAFRKGRGIRGQIANICWIIEKAREFQKNVCFVASAEVFVCITKIKKKKNCGNFFK